MHRDDERNAVILSRENPAPMRIPGVTVYDLGIDANGIKIDAASYCAESRAKRFRTIPAGHIQLKTAYRQIPGSDPLIAETADFYRHQLRQFARQIFHMHSSPAVSGRRIFVGQQKHFHE